MASVESLAQYQPTAQGLTLFSEREQFLLKGKDGILTPNAVTVDTISHYLMDSKIILYTLD